MSETKSAVKLARRKQFGQNLISLIHEIDKRVENQMWQETVSYVPLISYLGMVAAGIHGPPGPRTTRSLSVRHKKFFLGPCPVRSAGLGNFLVRVRSGPRTSTFFWLVRSGPLFQ